MAHGPGPLPPGHHGLTAAAEHAIPLAPSRGPYRWRTERPVAAQGSLAGVELLAFYRLLMSFDLAQVNIARLAADLGSPQLRDFVAALDPVNAEADLADGFRWRMQTEDGNATSVVGFGADQRDGVGVITNMSTWRDVESLAAYVFGPMHTAIMRRRREWFLPMRESYTACWWVPAGYRPSVSEAEDRVRVLRAQGPTPAAFTLKHHFAAPDDAQASVPTVRDDWMCGV